MPFPAVDPSLVETALRGASPLPAWLEDPGRPAPLPPLRGAARTDLAVVGGGYAGLWTALLAKERDPGRDVLLLEGATTGWAASGRNGGFVSASLTHGTANGRLHVPGELERLERLGLDNLDAIEAAVARYGMDCDFERTGSLDVAVEPHHVAQLRAAADDPVSGDGLELLDADEVRAEVRSPTYLAGLLDRRGTALVHPAKLVWELRRVCLELGVRIAERSPVRRLSSDRGGVHLHVEGPAASGRVSAGRVALATNAFPALLRRDRLHTLPVYDYALMTEPLAPAQREALGWKGRQGVGDVGNRFHYYRLTADDRLLFGGYDAVYHFGRALRSAHDARPATHRTLVAHLLATFPQLEGVRVTHAWGGAIDTCTRFFPFFSTGHGGRVAGAAGYTGLGVGATRFCAEVVLDLLAGTPTERTELEAVRRRPLPFPPEPLAWLGVQATTRALVRADRTGRRGPLLRVLDAAGVGFDS